MIRRRSKSRVALWEEEDGKDENGKTLEMGGKALDQFHLAKEMVSRRGFLPAG